MATIEKPKQKKKKKVPSVPTKVGSVPKTEDAPKIDSVIEVADEQAKQPLPGCSTGETISMVSQEPLGTQSIDLPDTFEGLEQLWNLDNIGIPNPSSPHSLQELENIWEAENLAIVPTSTQSDDMSAPKYNVLLESNDLWEAQNVCLPDSPYKEAQNEGSSTQNVRINTIENTDCDRLGDIFRTSVIPSAPMLERLTTDIQYPELPMHDDSQVSLMTMESSQPPYSEVQLLSFCVSRELCEVGMYEECFIRNELSGTNTKRHPLYELVQSYLNSKNILKEKKAELKKLQIEEEQCQGQLWILVNGSVTKELYCQDGVSVKATQDYTVAKFQTPILESLKQIQKEIEKLTHVTFSLYSSITSIVRLKIENYVQSVIQNCLKCTNTCKHTPVSLFYNSSDHIIQQNLAELRMCISVIFLFQRRVCKDKEFILESRHWLTHMVSVLLRVANWRDHMFLLNHVLRCPAGIGTWACKYVQMPIEPFGSSVFNNGYLSHIMTVLRNILVPVRKRDEFLENLFQLKDTVHDPQMESLWILVDSDGEEDEPNCGISPFKENDVIILFNQVPLKELFQSILLIEKVDGVSKYNKDIVDDKHILRVFAFNNLLVRFLCGGIQTYYQSRYHQFCKMLCCHIKHTLQHASDMWEAYRSDHKDMDINTLTRLEKEFDILFLRVSVILYRTQQMSGWQFLAILPFHMISLKVLWQIYYILHATKLPDHFENDDDVEIDYTEKLSDTAFRQAFDERLCALSADDSYYLLHAYANMVMSRDACDSEFIEFATIDILQIGFFGEGAQENCSKCAAILLSNITSRYPHLISNILASVKENISNIGQLCKPLFDELPLKIYQPTQKDMDILSNWLVRNTISSIGNSLARLILLRLNWGFWKDELCIPYDIHCQVALMVAEAIEILAPEVGYSVLEGFRQAVQTTVEQSFIKWCWQMIYQLQLHATDRGNFDVSKVPDITKYDILQKGMREGRPLSIYLAVKMTTIGHLVPIICTQGLSQIKMLLAKHRYDATIILVHSIVPLFEDSQQALLNSPNFQNILITLLGADRTYLKYAKSLIAPEFPGTILKQIASMIELHIHGSNWLKLINFWIQALVGLPNWNKDSEILYLLNIVLRTGVFNPNSYACIIRIFQNILEKSTKGQSSSSLFSWILQNNNPAAYLLTGGTQSTCPWVAYIVIFLEYEYNEVRTGLWMELLNQLYKCKGKVSVDSCLKKAANIVNVNSFSVGCLCIYRWGQQAVDTPLNHPILPLLWQRFFSLYLARVQVPPSGADGGSMGSKFFEGFVNQASFKTMKKRLQESLEFFKTMIDELKEMEKEGKTNSQITMRITFYERCLKIFKAYALWLEEPMLQEASLHLSSLPPQYEPKYLGRVLKNDPELWIEFVSFESIHSEHQKATVEWDNICYRKTIKCSQPPQAKGANEVKNPAENIIYMLESYDKPLIAPPIPKCKPLMTQIDLKNRDAIKIEIAPYLKNILKTAVGYSLRIAEHSSLDCQYNEAVTQLYTLVPNKVTRIEKCKPTCTGSVAIVLKYRESRKNDAIRFQLSTNRTNFSALLTQTMQPISRQFCTDCLSIEFAIHCLQARLERSIHLKDLQKENEVRAIGVEFFYYLFNSYGEEIKFFPPTKHLFTHCMEKLGQIFIVGVETETVKLFHHIINNQAKSDILIPHFKVSNFSTDVTLQLYENLVDKIRHLKDIPLALLSKIDIARWLFEKRPRLYDRSRFINMVFKALTSLSFKITRENGPLHLLLRSHLVLIFRHEFPEHYGEILTLVLQNSGNQNLSSSVYLDLLGALIAPTCLAPDVPIREQLRQIATKQMMLRQEVLVQTAGLLATFYTQDRLQFGLYGLYPKYRVYIDPIEFLLGITGHCVIVSTLNLYSGLLGDQLGDMIWPAISDMFSPWLVPYWLQQYKDSTAVWIQQLVNDRAVLLPWTPNDINHAQRIFNMFVECIQFVLDTLPACSTMLSYAWKFYAINFGHTCIKEHIWVVVHKSLKLLPWNKFWPSLADLESMLKVIDQYLPECHTFLGYVFLEIDWTNWLHKLMSSGNIVASIKAHHCLLHLLVKLSNEPNVRQDIKSQTLLENARNYSWHLLDAMSLEQVLDWYVQSVDPKVVLGDENMKIIDLAVFELLKLVSCMNLSNENWDPLSMKKRQLFLRTNVKLLVNCASRYKDSITSIPQKFKTTIKDNLDHIEHIISHVWQDPFIERNCLTSELLSTLNNAALASILTETFESWISERTADSIILQTFLGSIDIVLTNNEVTGTLLECAFDSYFKVTVSQNCVLSWKHVVKLFNIGHMKQPPLEQSLVANGRVLTLYAILLTHLDHNVSNKALLLETVLDWLEKLKVTDVIEPKLPLLWAKVLEISYQLSSVDTVKVVGCLKRLTNHLLIISESKGVGWGRNLLGAIGIGKQNSISINGRFLSKAIAGYVLAQLPDPKGGVQTVRTFSGASGPVGQPGGNTECAKILLKLDMKNADLKACTELALKQIQDPQNSLHNALEFTFGLVEMLYSKPYLKST